MISFSRLIINKYENGEKLSPTEIEMAIELYECDAYSSSQYRYSIIQIEDRYFQVINPSFEPDEYNFIKEVEPVQATIIVGWKPI